MSPNCLKKIKIRSAGKTGTIIFYKTEIAFDKLLCVK